MRLAIGTEIIHPHTVGTAVRAEAIGSHAICIGAYAAGTHAQALYQLVHPWGALL